MKSPSEIVDLMYNNDAYSQWLGIERLNDSLGGSHLKMQIRDEMCNGFKIAHGGISYSFADSAFAFACNSHGLKSVSIETSISHVAPLHSGDWIEAIATKKHSSRKIGVYEVVVRKLDGTVVGLFKGTCYNTSKEW
jgi:acyl-CoA thioesterase